MQENRRLALPRTQATAWLLGDGEAAPVRDGDWYYDRHSRKAAKVSARRAKARALRARKVAAWREHGHQVGKAHALAREAAWLEESLLFPTDCYWCGHLLMVGEACNCCEAEARRALTQQQYALIIPAVKSMPWELYSQECEFCGEPTTWSHSRTTRTPTATSTCICSTTHTPDLGRS